MSLVKLYAPTNSGNVTGVDLQVYKICSGIVEVPAACVAALVTAGYVLAPTPEVDTSAEVAALVTSAAVVAALGYTPVGGAGVSFSAGVLTLNGAAGGLKLPTADPHVAGVWWDSAGTLTKSAG
jgi:hypothetical protein